MKKEIVQFLSIAFACLLSVSVFAQEPNEPVKVYKKGGNHSTEAPPPPPPPPPITPIECEEVFKVVEEMPRFPGCEDQGLSRKELQECAKGKLLEYIITHLKYPEKARKNETEGMVVLQFNIAKDGSMEDIKVVRDVEDGCGQAAKDVFVKMQSELKWIPGTQRGRPVKVQYTMPVKFKL